MSMAMNTQKRFVSVPRKHNLSVVSISWVSKLSQETQATGRWAFFLCELATAQTALRVMH